MSYYQTLRLLAKCRRIIDNLAHRHLPNRNLFRALHVRVPEVETNRYGTRI
jgi:hypothetical protein